MNAPTTAAALAAAAFQDIDLKQIVLSQTLMQVHRRASLNKEAMKMLTENVRQVGVIQPVLLRPITGGKYELVAGERRFLAATSAGLKTIPAMVRPLTDLQALELQVIENKQREDLHELIEAEGFEELMKTHKYTAEQIAAKVGMSLRYVYNRLKLLDLGPELRAAFLDGQVNNSIAQLLARIPVHDLQRQAFKEINNRSSWNGGPMSVREAAEHLQKNYMLRLDQAPFKTGDEKLVPKAGACGPCPKRTGNQKELFPDVKSADVCTDPSCFQAKKTAHAEQLRKSAEEKGQTVIAGDAAKKIKPNDWGDLKGGFVEVDKEKFIGGRLVSPRKLLGKAMPDTTLLQDPRDGTKFIEIVQHTAIAQAMTAKGIRLDPPRSQGNSADAENRKNQRLAKFMTAMREEIFLAIREKPVKLGHEELVMIALATWENLEGEERARLEVIWEWREKDADEEIVKLDDSQLARLMLDMALVEEVKVNTWRVKDNVAKNLLAVAKKVGADAAGITKKHQDAFDAKEKERTARKRKIEANAKKKIKAAATPKPAKAAKKAKKS